MDESESRFRVSAQDLRQYDWQQIIKDHPTKKCKSYRQVLGKRSSELDAAGDDLGCRVFALLHVVASFLPRFDSKGNPFGPFETDGSWRSLIAEDLTDFDLEALKGIYEEVGDPEFRARISDVLWECKRDYKAANVAVHAYIESARILETPDLWPSFVERLERAAQLSAKLGFGKSLHQMVLAEIEAVIERFENVPESGRLCTRLMRLLFNHEAGDSTRYSALAEKWAEDLAARQEWNFSSEYWSTAEMWFRKAGLQADAQRCALRAAECMISKAEGILAGARPSKGSAAHWMAVGLAGLRQARADKDRVAHVHQRLLDLQAEARTELHPLEMDPEQTMPGFREKEKEVQEAARAHVSGFPFEGAVERLAFIKPLTDTQALSKQVEEEAKEHPFSHIGDTVALDHSGKVADTAPSLVFAATGEDKAEALRVAMVRHAMEFDWQFLIVWYVEPARKCIYEEHPVRFRDLEFLIANNPFVPPGHESICARGLQAGFHGDWLVAMHLLIPQLEASIRHVFKHAGVVTSTLEADQTQKERDLNQLMWLPEMEKIFGQSVTFELRGLLIDKFGHNMRNELAHGLMHSGLFYHFSTTHVWWLALRLCWKGFEIGLSAMAEGAGLLEGDSGPQAATPEDQPT